MFSSSSNFKNINIISKIVSLLFMIITITVMNNPILIVIFSLLFLMINRFNLLSVITLVISICNMHYALNILIKILLIINYLNMFKNIINFNEVRYFMEDLFYKRFKGLLKRVIYIMYFYREFKDNILDKLNLFISYGFNINIKNILFIIKESFNKSKSNCNKIMITYKYRLYNSLNKRTYVDKDKLDSYDFKYILVYVIIFLVVYIVESL